MENQALLIFLEFIAIFIVVIVLILVTNFIGLDRARRDDKEEANRNRMAELIVRNQQASNRIAGSLSELAAALALLSEKNKPK